MTKNKDNFRIILIYIGSMFLLAIGQLIAIDINPLLRTDDDLFITYSSISNLVWYLMLFMIFIIVYKKYFWEQTKELIRDRNRLVSVIAIGIFSLYAVSIISSLILQSLGISDTSENQDQLTQLLDGKLFDRISLILFTVIFAPLVEEFVFRKAILNLFHFEVEFDDGSKKIKRKKILFATIAVLVSGLIFGLIHVTSGDFEQILIYGSLGCVLGVIYLVAKKNLFAPIIVHLLLNLISIIFLFSM